jgi:gamma-glutamyltranspeptidase/glutathione hydrolase
MTSGLGGEALILIYGADGRTQAIDGSCYVPHLARPDELQSSRVAADRGYIQDYNSVAVPGSLAALAYALERYGTESLAEVLAPAIDLADFGYNLNPSTIAEIDGLSPYLRHQDYVAGFILKDFTDAWGPDHVFCASDLAKTLRRIAALGPAEFYRGRIADEIDADMNRHGGYLRKSDLVTVRAVERQPIRDSYRGLQVITFPYPGGGGSLIEMLHILETFPSKLLQDASLDRLHLLVEAARLTWADNQNSWMPLPLVDHQLTDRLWAAQRAKLIRFDRALRPGEISGDVPEPYLAVGTTQVSVVDRWGNAVALSQTLGAFFGAAVATPGLGFFYNANLNAFNYRNPLSPHYLRPGQVPATAMTPTIILKDGKPLLVLGSAGSDRVVPTMVSVISGVADRGLDSCEAVAAPRAIWGTTWGDPRPFVELAGESRCPGEARLSGDLPARVSRALGRHLGVRRNQRRLHRPPDRDARRRARPAPVRVCRGARGSLTAALASRQVVPSPGMHRDETVSYQFAISRRAKVSSRAQRGIWEGAGRSRLSPTQIPRRSAPRNDMFNGKLVSGPFSTSVSPGLAARSQARPSRPTPPWSARLVALALVLPNVTWIVLSRALWSYDACEYGSAAIELYNTLIRNPSMWLCTLFDTYTHKAPLIFWAGQVFVPLGRLLGSIPIGLDLMMALTQYVTLILAWRLFEETFATRSLAFAGLLLVGTAPLFVGLSTKFLVEPLQLLLVIWFLVLMARAPRRDGLGTVLHVTAAASLAMLAKVTSPLYCAGPGLVALFYAFRQGPRTWRWDVRRHGLLTAATLVLAVSTLVWYWRNLGHVVGFVQFSSSRPMWGRHDTFLNKFAYWSDALCNDSFMRFVPYLMLAALAVASGLHLIRRPRPRAADTLALVSCLQILVALTVMSAQVNDTTRYLLPTLPYLAALLVWSLARIDRAWLTAAVVAVCLVQVAGAEAVTFNLPRPRAMFRDASLYELHLWSLDRDVSQADLAKRIVRLTCGTSPVKQVVACGQGPPGAALLRFYYLAESAPARTGCEIIWARTLATGGTDEAAAAANGWQNLLKSPPAYFVDAEPSSYKLPDLYTTDRQTMREYRATWRILERVRHSSAFRRIEVPGHPEALLFEFVGSEARPQ